MEKTDQDTDPLGIPITSFSLQFISPLNLGYAVMV